MQKSQSWMSSGTAQLHVAEADVERCEPAAGADGSASVGMKKKSVARGSRV
jgi:hypothetical protein